MNETEKPIVVSCEARATSFKIKTTSSMKSDKAHDFKGKDVMLLATIFFSVVQWALK